MADKYFIPAADLALHNAVSYHSQPAPPWPAVASSRKWAAGWKHPPVGGGNHCGTLGQCHRTGVIQPQARCVLCCVVLQQWSGSRMLVHLGRLRLTERFRQTSFER